MTGPPPALQRDDDWRLRYNDLEILFVYSIAV